MFLGTVALAAPNLWEWITATTSTDSILNTLGLAGLAVLFATDRIMTKGQHTRRVADIMAANKALLDEKADRYGEMKESRNFYRDAWNHEKGMRVEVTGQLAESTQVAKVAAQALTALDTARTPGEVAEHG